MSSFTSPTFLPFYLYKWCRWKQEKLICLRTQCSAGYGILVEMGGLHAVFSEGADAKL